MSIKQEIALRLFRQYRKNQARLHELNYLFWECTLRCNFACLHCGSDCTRQTAVPDMPLADFLKALDSIGPHVDPHNTLIVLTGGEPLMRPDIEECGREFYRREFPWGMVTNGYALTPERLQRLVGAGLRSLTISLDGLTPDTHDWFRGKKGAWQHATRAIAAAARTQGLTFDVVTCVNQRNKTELDGMKQLLASMGVKQWRLFMIFAKGRASGNPLLQLQPADFRALMEFIKTTRAEGVIKASFGCEGYLGPYETAVRDTPFFCRAGIQVGSVLADGSISACPSLRDDYTQGNIYRDDFWDVWSNRFQVMRDRSWTRTGKCAACKDYKFCEGNGLHLRNQRTGELLCCHLDLLK